MDKILVTLLLVIVGVGAVVGLSQWANDQKNAVQNSANTAITNVSTPATTNAQ
jgi:hypothetical protein